MTGGLGRGHHVAAFIEDELFIDDELFIECIADGLGLGEPLIESAIAGAAVINAAARIAIK